MNKNRPASWIRGLGGFVHTVLIYDRLDPLWDEVVMIKPDVLLLDFDLLNLNGLEGAGKLSRLCAETKVIVLSGVISEDLEWKLVKAGVRGCCQADIKPQFIKQIVMAVQQGELWIRRTLTSRLVDELGKTTSKNKAYRASLGLLNNLTQREFDIAVLVGDGESNKRIAQLCAITERTVKAHLTEVYQKLGVTDRLNLALILSSENGNNKANLESQKNNSHSQSDKKSDIYVKDSKL